ncbi:MAG: M48 family metallopeptidase [Clostridia bacterium]|nr:M48 family metallopeptidase [Deltaproteobacteria bacterium]
MRWTVVTVLMAVACATSPTGRKQFIIQSDDSMATLGAQSFTEIAKETPVTTNQNAVRYVTCIASSVTEILPKEYSGEWDIKVFESDQVNAFALPGRKIGVYTGLLKVASNQDQVATVLGHEIGHVIARHGNERVSENVVLQGGMSIVDAFSGSGAQHNMIMGALGVGAQYGVVLPHNRTQEAEADRIGLDYMAQAGFNPEESVKLWGNMSKAANGKEPSQFTSTHPSNANRISGLQEGMAKAKGEQEAAHAAGKSPQCGASGVAAN